MNENSSKGSHLPYKSYKIKAKMRSTPAEKSADFFTKQFGSFTFLVLNIAWFVIWILINTGKVPGIEPFDPFPFIFLTLCVSLEAIILTTIVLISQNRESRVDDIRDEIDTRIDIEAEEEITKVLEILIKIARKNDIDLSKDERLKKMLKPVDTYYLEKKFESEV
jgi:uncharacterized membrane protein